MLLPIYKSNDSSLFATFGFEAWANTSRYLVQNVLPVCQTFLCKHFSTWSIEIHEPSVLNI